MQKFTKNIGRCSAGRYLSTSRCQDNDVVIVGCSRTPIGKFGGVLSSYSAPKLGAYAIEGAIIKSGIDKNLIEECFMGNVVSAGIGQAPARQSVIYSGLPLSTEATTINKVCASGMKSIMFAALSISSGYRNVCVAGGMESMSNIPYYLPGARNGYRLGNNSVVDGLVNDGLWDIYNNQHMGMCGEACAKEYGISRHDQDNYAAMSYKRAAEAWAAGRMKDEVTAISCIGKDKKETLISADEEFAGFKPDKISSLRPAFSKDGTITAANASKLSDGASAFVMMSYKKAKELNLVPLFKIRGFGDAAKDPVQFTTAPADAVPRALKHAGVAAGDVEYHEINEAFSVVALANARLLHLDLSRVNVHGGAVALGHPLGASGARIVGALYNVLKHNDATIGCASICNGGGAASAIVIERLN